MRTALQIPLAATFCVAAFCVQAACLPGEVPVLSCTAKAGARVLDVCIAGPQIRYSYGRPGQPPDLQLAEGVATVAHQPWNGVGRSIWEATTFHNAAHAYEVFVSVDRMAEGQPTASGVSVTKGGAEVARVDCDAGSDQFTLWAVSDAKQAQGICWNSALFAWGHCE